MVMTRIHYHFGTNCSSIQLWPATRRAITIPAACFRYLIKILTINPANSLHKSRSVVDACTMLSGPPRQHCNALVGSWCMLHWAGQGRMSKWPIHVSTKVRVVRGYCACFLLYKWSACKLFAPKFTSCPICLPQLLSFAQLRERVLATTECFN